MAAAAGRDVGEDLAAGPGYEPGEGLGLSADFGSEVRSTFMAVLDSSIVNITASAAGIEVERQHAPGARTGIKHRHRARLARRVCRKRPRVPGRVGAAAITGDPDMGGTRDRRRDGAPGGLRGGAREAVRAVRVH